MLERFTDRARNVMALADQEARRFNHASIGSEHILLGLVKEGSGVAANVLRNLGVDLRSVRREVEKLAPPGVKAVAGGDLPQTLPAQNVLAFAIEEARNLNHNYVGTEHLLLGLLRNKESVAAQVLMNLGLKLDELRAEILSLLGVGGEPHEPVAGKQSFGRGSVELNMGRLPRSPSVQTIIECAIEEACRLNHTTLDAVHLMLGLLRDKEGLPARALQELGLDLENVRRKVISLMSTSSPAVKDRTLTWLAGLPENKARFTDRAVMVMALADHEAQRWGHEHIDTEHILLALLKEGAGVGVTVLRGRGVDLELVRTEVEMLIKPGSEMAPPCRLPLTPCARQVIADAVEETRSLNHTYVGTEHLLLGLLRAQEGVAAQVLGRHGLNVATTRADVVRFLGA